MYLLAMAAAWRQKCIKSKSGETKVSILTSKTELFKDFGNSDSIRKTGKEIQKSLIEIIGNN